MQEKRTFAKKNMKRLILFLLSFIAVFQIQAQDVTVFEHGQDGYTCFRIPTIVNTRNGHLLAFAEGRKNSCSDTGDIDIVMKRSTDGGKTWSSTQLVWDAGENVCGNACPILDTETGSLVLLCCWNLGEDHEPQIIASESKDTRRVFVLTSDDDGHTWSTPRDITSQVKLENWTWYATGPCHGTMLQHGTHAGRMISGTNHMVKGSGAKHSAIIYSDDHGESWHLGAIQQEEGGNESTVAELSNGTILLNMRNYDRSQAPCRSLLRSYDGGQNASITTFATDLIEPVCQGSMLATPKGTLVFCNPYSKDSRENLSLHISNDGGQTWPQAITVCSGLAAYSDLVLLNQNTVGVLYETGINEPYERIVFSLVSVP